MRSPERRTGRRAAIATLSAALLAALVAAPGPAGAEPTVAGGSAVSGPAAVSAGHRSRGHARSHRRSHVSTSWYFGWGPYWGPYWGPRWGGYWDGYGYGYGYGPRFGYTTVYPRPGAVYGALDTDISPERAEVWLDGERIGVADDFDGFPDYLWLEKGTYDVVFYLPGYKTLARQYSIYPGLVIDVGDRLEDGESVHPNDLGPASHERRDARLARERELRERVEAETRRREAAPREGAGRGELLDARAEPGRLRLRVEPEDASVYLDGRFLGTGGDLARLRAGLLVDGGLHRLEVVRPGYGSVEREVEIEVGEETALAIELVGAGDDG